MHLISVIVFYSICVSRHNPIFIFFIKLFLYSSISFRRPLIEILVCVYTLEMLDIFKLRRRLLIIVTVSGIVEYIFLEPAHSRVLISLILIALLFRVTDPHLANILLNGVQNLACSLPHDKSPLPLSLLMTHLSFLKLKKCLLVLIFLFFFLLSIIKTIIIIFVFIIVLIICIVPAHLAIRPLKLLLHLLSHPIALALIILLFACSPSPHYLLLVLQLLKLPPPQLPLLFFPYEPH